MAGVLHIGRRNRHQFSMDEALYSARRLPQCVVRALLSAILAAFLLTLTASPLHAQEPAPVENENIEQLDSEALKEEAARQLAEAEAARAAAEAERQALIETEKARLEAAEQVLELEAAKVQNEAAAIELIEARATSWHQRATAIAASSNNAAQADALYDELIIELGQVRSDLGQALRRSGLREADTGPDIPALDPALADAGTEGRELLNSGQALAMRAVQLADLIAQQRIERRDALYEAMLTMNGVRLEILPSLSSQRYSRVTGFGDEGFAQVRREAHQIILTARYNITTGFAGLKEFADELVRFRASAILDLLMLAFAILVFRFWHGISRDVVYEMQRPLDERKPPTLFTSIVAYLLRMLRHALRPLNWLIFLLVLEWLFPWFFAPAAIRVFWLLACWMFGGAALVQVIDMIAKGESDEDPRAALRRRSLRLVAAVTIGIGLVLSLTSNMLGHGAIYSWLLTLCWLLVVPVIILLTTWWRERIETLARLGASSNSLLAWVANNPSGIRGALGRVAAGMVLMVQGVRVVVSRRIRQLSLIREILGQRARKKANEKVIADAESGRYRPVPEQQTVPFFQPERSFDGTEAELDGLSPDIEFHPGHITALVGNRGYGKTSLLQRTCNSNKLPVIYVAVTSENGQDILEKLADKLGCARDMESIADALKASPHCIAIDDFQRIIVPAIGGLETFDAIIDLARDCGGETSWIFAIDGAVWPYIVRARSDRPLFDKEVRLSPWPVERIRNLIEQRTAEAGLDPQFEPITEDAGTILFEEELPPEEHAKRAFFKALTEETLGNPAVALQRWRRSLFHDQESGAVCVRTFRAPEIARLGAMPSGTLFVLRAILQMDIAGFDSIARATDLAPEHVREILRACELLGVVVKQGEDYRLSLYWFQEVKRLLQAQNLLAGALP